MTLDGNATLALQVHIVQHLALSHLNGLRAFQKPVGQGRLSVVNMSDNAEVAYMLHVVSAYFECKITKKIRVSYAFSFFFRNFVP